VRSVRRRPEEGPPITLRASLIAQIYLFGHGAGAHLSLLAVVQEAVVRSRDEWWLRAYEQNPNIDDASIELAAGIQRLGASAPCRIGI